MQEAPNVLFKQTVSKIKLTNLILKAGGFLIKINIK